MKNSKNVNLRLLICSIIFVLTTESFSQSNFVRDSIPNELVNEHYNNFASECEQGGGVFSGNILNNGNGTSKIIWSCYYCNSSPIVEMEIMVRKAICKASCVSGSYVRCHEDGTGYQISDCDYNLPIYYNPDNPDTHHCPLKDGESSSSSEELSSSSSELSSSSSENYEDEENSSSSGGSGSGGDCTGIGQTCPLSSGSSGGIITCGATTDELVPILTELIYDCEENKLGENRYDVEYFETNPLERSFCITGECKEAESSSSSEEESSSSSEESSSSSDYGDYYGNSCQISDEHWSFMSSFGVFKRTLYSDYPEMQNASNIQVSGCSCGVDGTFFACNLNNFDYVHDYTVFGLSLCSFSHGYWCNGIEKGSCNFSGRSAYVYHSDKLGYDWVMPSMNSSGLYPYGATSSFFELRETISGRRELLFYHNYLFPSNVSTYDIESAILEAMPAFPSLNRINEYCRGEWVPHDEDCFGTEQEVETALGDSVYFCASLGGKTGYSTELSNRGWCVIGECEFDDIIVSSSSEEISSSSNSNYPSHPLPSVPSDPLNARFEINGKCYKCNSARGNECSNDWLWIYGFVESNIGWWYEEIDCNSGSDNYSSSSEENSSSSQEVDTACKENRRGADAVYTANDCFNSGLDNMEAGKCYSLNPERGTQHGWINNDAQDRWWWVETSCGTARMMFLSKDSKSSKEDISYEIWGNKTRFYYDALGRKTQEEPDTRRFLFVPK